MTDLPHQTESRTAGDGHQPVSGGKVFLTGGSGFVGRYVLRRLVSEGYEPVCLVRDAWRLQKQVSTQVWQRSRVVEGDLHRPGILEHGLENCTAAMHLVGIIEERPSRGQTFERIHAEGTRRAVDACAATGVKRYVHMSALGSRPNAVSRYHRTKWEAEEAVRSSPLQWTIFRPSMIHGVDGEFMQMMHAMCTDRLRYPVMPYFGSGRNLLQPISVEDVAACFVKSLSLPETIGQVYELGGPDRFTWRELYDICAEVINGSRRMKMSMPAALARLLAVTVVPLVPRALMPQKFNVAQVQMSQEDSICETEPIEQTFGIKLRAFRDELRSYAERMG